MNQPSVRLADNVAANSDTLEIDGDISDWKVGDEIGIGATNKDGTGFEKREISAISG